jgi:general secretion pathway protein G
MNNTDKHAPISLESERGMTLVELLVVIVLISLIAVVVGKNVIGKSEGAKADLNVVRMNDIKQYIGQYRLKYNTYPTQLSDLTTPSAEVKKSGQIFTSLASEEELKDIWGFPYIYKLSNGGRTYTLSSLGSDGIEGGEGANQDVTITP